MRASTLALLVHGPAVAAAFVHGGGSPASPASPALLRPRTVAAAATTTAADDTTAKQAAFDEVVMKTYGRYPITMVKGKGAHLWDSTGKEVGPRARGGGGGVRSGQVVASIDGS